MIYYQAIFGVNSGYAHENGLPEGTTADQIVARAWRDALEEEFDSSEILVGGFVSAGRIAYPLGFGCPEDGEVAAMVSGNSNPKFVSPEQLPDFREAVVRVVERTKEKLGQERVRLAFSEVSGFVYFEPEETGGTQRW